jgi:hypothetical protein
VVRFKRVQATVARAAAAMPMVLQPAHEAVLESVPELRVEKKVVDHGGSKPPFTPYYKSWPGGRHDDVPVEGLRCLDDASVVNRMFIDAIGGSAANRQNCLQELREMEEQNTVFQMRSKAMNAEISKKVAGILEEYDRHEADGTEMDGDKGRKAAELIRQLQDTGERRCDEVMQVERWHKDNENLGESMEGELDEPDVIYFLKEELKRVNEERAAALENESGDEDEGDGAGDVEAKPLEPAIIEGLDMSDPASWDWNAMMSGKREGRAQIEAIVKQLLEELIRLSKEIEGIDQRVRAIEDNKSHLVSQTMVLEQRIKELHDKANESRAIRDDAIRVKERDERAIKACVTEKDKAKAEEKDRRTKHQHEMARLQAMLNKLLEEHKRLMGKMTDEHNQKCKAIEEANKEELDRLRAAMSLAGLDIDAMTEEAKMMLEAQDSPYAESKITALRARLEELLAREQELLALIQERQDAIEAAKAALAAAEARRKLAEENMPVADTCEWGNEALAEWKRLKDEYFQWLDGKNSREQETEETQTDPVLLPAIEVAPDKIDAPSVEEHSDDEHMTTVEICNNGEGPLEVLELMSDAEWVTFEPDVGIPAVVEPKNFITVTVTLSPWFVSTSNPKAGNGAPGMYGANLSIVTNDPGGPVVIPMSIEVTEAPDELELILRSTPCPSRDVTPMSTPIPSPCSTPEPPEVPR